MKKIILLSKHNIFLFSLLLSLNSFSQDFNIQHVQEDVGNNGASNSSFAPVSSLNSAFLLSNNNRKVSAGRIGNSGNLQGDDMAGAAVLTALDEITYFRESASVNANTRFSSSIWEYIGENGGNNEMIVRGRYAINLNGGTNSNNLNLATATGTLSAVNNANNCIPFITGIMNSTGSQDADSGTALAYLENDGSSMRVFKGSNANNVTVYITLIEFTGSNWAVLHGDSGNTGSDTGSITLKTNADGTGTTANVNDWSESIIFSHHIGDTGSSGANDAIADNWPLMRSGGNNQSVDWVFNSNHDSAGTNRHFTHVLLNNNLNVTRYQSNSDAANENTIDISSANLTNINQALIIGSSNTSGGGSAYGRGWRNYYFNSVNQAAHWSHRSGNTMLHEIQIVDLSSLTSNLNYCASNGDDTDGYFTGIRQVAFNTINNSTPIEDNGYSDFTAISTTVNQTSSYDLSVNVNTDGDYTSHTFAWIDWNQDGDFDDAGESFDLGIATNVENGATSASPFSILIPATSTLGTTRMRVSSKYFEDPTSCEIGFDGEVEDYSITIATITEQEIDVVGNGISIVNADTTPSLSDNTDFGSVLTAGGTNVNTFTIHNIGVTNLILNGGVAPFVSISGTHAGDFTISANASSPITAGSSTNFDITFDPSANGLRSAIVTINNNDSDENPFTFNIQGTGVDELTYCFSSGDDTDGYFTGIRQVAFNTINNPTPVEDNGYSDFTAISTTVNQTFSYDLSVNVNTDGDYTSHTFAWIDWNQDGDFDDAGESFDLGIATDVENGATSASPFSILIPATSSLGTTRMRVSTKYFEDPTSCEIGFDGEVEDYSITITPQPQPEINIIGNGISIVDGDVTPSITDDTDFGGTVAGSPFTRTYTIENTGNLPLTIGAISFGGANPADFIVSAAPPANIAAGSSATFSVNFDPTGLGTRSSLISIVNGDISGEDPYNFALQGDGLNPLTEGPGGVTSYLALWLKSSSGLTYNDGQSVSFWADHGHGSDAVLNSTGQEPTFRDNVSKNINFNPVVEFDNTYTSSTLDSDFSYDNTSTQFLEGTSGMYTQDIFMVFVPDETPLNSSFGFMDVFCGDADSTTNASDETGIGFGNYTNRVSDETICFAINSDSNSPNGGFAVHDGPNTSYSNVGIVNTRNNTAANQQELFYNANNIGSSQNDIPAFLNVNDSRYWIGRSEGREASTNGRIAEIITYSARKSDANLNDERNKIQSYLALKYGITLGVNGISQDYVGSDGTVIWDVNTGTPINDAFNYDIAGIGRDNVSALNQKQSRSVNNELDGATRGQGVLTMGVSNIFDTNNLNLSSALNDKNYLIWGNNGIDLDVATVVHNINLSENITPAISGGTQVQLNAIARTWKVAENGGDIPSVEVAILESALRSTISPNGVYLMFISDSPDFSQKADYRIMSADTNELGENVLTTNYDFNGTKYITFGWAPERTYDRSVYFNGSSDYIDISDALDLDPSAFTISAWIKRDASDTGIASIVSKRGNTFTEGYDLSIKDNNTIQFNIKNGTNQVITSSTAIPDGKWHQVAIIYNGTTVFIYIDGVLDNSVNITAPIDTTESFLIGAAGKNSQTQYFNGNIDEVRIWNTNLTESQLRFIMNQEIDENSNFVNGKYFMTNGITPTKNDIATIPWSDLAGYYPMSTFIFTNIIDASGNNNFGALKNMRSVDKQTAPLPYESAADGDWDTNSTWENGTFLTIPGATSIVDNTVTIDWNIMITNHNLTMDNSNLPTASNDNRAVLGLIVESNTLTLNGDNETGTGNALTVSHYLELDGKIDLQGESQFIQNKNSDLALSSAGSLEKDQQGSSNLYNYNYWSSPVNPINTIANNTNYSINGILRDGSNSSAPTVLQWTSSVNANGSTNPITLSNRWLYAYENFTAGSYAAWRALNQNDDLATGLGFTMKGSGAGDPINDVQNYVFVGKPNNGTITNPITAGNEALVGNPYASAIDANEFILDNVPGGNAGTSQSTDGTLYFWEHYESNNTHVLEDYEGGYATYNLIGGNPAVSPPLVSGLGTPSKLPGRYIPVSQGFFVNSSLTGGNVTFNNDQRIFVRKTSTNSTFFRSNNANHSSTDDRTESSVKRIRLNFKTPEGAIRPLLLGFVSDGNATDGFDYGYDAENIDEELPNDATWMINDKNYTTQGVGAFDSEKQYPLGLFISIPGEIQIELNELENFESTIDVFIYDALLNTYTSINDSNYIINLEANNYLNRFFITFSNQTLGIEYNEIQDITTFFNNETHSVVINNSKNLKIQSVEVINMLGQSIFKHEINKIETFIEIEAKGLSTGTYIIKLETEIGVVSKKVLVK